MDSFLVSQALLQNIEKGKTVTNALAYRKILRNMRRGRVDYFVEKSNRRRGDLIIKSKRGLEAFSNTSGPSVLNLFTSVIYECSQ